MRYAPLRQQFKFIYMRNIILRNIQGKKVLILVVICMMVYFSMIWITIPKVQSYAQGYKILDLMPTGYSLSYVHSLFDALGESGRAEYLCTQIPVDLIYPALFGISSCLLIAFLLSKLNKIHTAWFYSCYLPIIAAVFDYAENIGIITMLKHYPHIHTGTYIFTYICTLCKSWFTSVYVILLGVLIFWILLVNVSRYNHCNAKFSHRCKS